MTRFIGQLIEKDYINASQARALEAFVYGTLFALAIGILENVEIILNGGDISWKTFFATFTATTLNAVMMGIKKYLRDKASQVDNMDV